MAFFKRNKNEEKHSKSAIAEEPAAETEEKVKQKPKRKRSATFGMCLTPEELQELNEGAQQAGMSRTDYIMASVRGTNIIVMEGLPQVLRELQYQGHNLNQLVRQINSGYRIDNEQVELVIYACMSAYTELVRFVDTYDVRIKKLKEDKENADHQN